MTLAEFLPQIRPWVENLENVWPGVAVKPYFAAWEVGHILSLAMLGGTSILINLRLIGAGLTSERPSEIYRNLRPWLHLGVVGIIVTGILIGTSNAERLYSSQAFIVKMAALLAGIIFTYGVSARIAKADGAADGRAYGWTAVGGAVWLFALWLFSTAELISPGVFHILSAGALIVFIANSGRMRWLYLAGLLALIAAQYVATHIIIPADQYDRLDPVNIAFAWVFAGWIVGWALAQMLVVRSPPAAGWLGRAAGYATILIWVTGGAAGRWIAFA
jgi:hypothetical protein